VGVGDDVERRSRDAVDISRTPPIAQLLCARPAFPGRPVGRPRSGLVAL